ncbi:DUF2478 domain-containing protein [Rhizobiales bacterium RZME27]|uniref:DUF2478 domain-containing protein n=1 Tax=Endobacterium cereale TaxID=2663029 RepID=A0A6A8ABI4_9HYPH|nr:DUF2478 domain-containing protein [Endobacterium cereale]MEB2844129.1 DUF2478 domain-containing protein [Endobacterium cereale]MQY48542.1 DUF2478 domain-containing protein [Endobacterium cereale]
MPNMRSAPLAAIVLPKGTSAEPLFDSLIKTLMADGVRVAGHVQREYPVPAGHDAEVVAKDIETGETFTIMQPRGGPGSGCRLDTGVLADLAGRTLARMNKQMEVLVLNRFGRTETEGNGLRAVYEKALELDVPVLTSVKPEHVEGWNAYTGDMSVLLPFDEEAVLTWCRSVLGRGGTGM